MKHLLKHGLVSTHKTTLNWGCTFSKGQVNEAINQMENTWGIKLPSSHLHINNLSLLM